MPAAAGAAEVLQKKRFPLAVDTTAVDDQELPPADRMSVTFPASTMLSSIQVAAAPSRALLQVEFGEQLQGRKAAAAAAAAAT